MPKQIDTFSEFEKYKEKFIDFSGNNPDFVPLAKIQEEGSLALFDILQKEPIAYLADEVGMGKTFISIGTVLLMRYLDPTLRVLFIAPNRQLKSQWIEEYERFIKNHVKVSHGNIKSFDGNSAVQSANCNSLKDMIEKTNSSYYSDYFVQMNSFSFGLDKGNKTEDNFYKDNLNYLKYKVPAYQEIEESINIFVNNKYRNILKSEELNKKKIKIHYAVALNYVLPSFDLIVVDEAHKFKNGINSSSRNEVLSYILGTQKFNYTVNEKVRANKELSKKVLLLSATPFDRDLMHIRNQIELFSGEVNAKNYFPLDKSRIQEDILNNPNDTLKKFMVRRLNQVQIAKIQATRNMYREEHRNLPVELKDFKHKLIMALVQKHLGEKLENSQIGSPFFQMGLLASFESFSNSVDNKIDLANKESKDEAVDANLIQKLNYSYSANKKLDGNTMPHPKMNEVVSMHCNNSFANGEKHLFFVRRIKSVKELVGKWNDKYNEWLKSYLIQSGTYPSNTLSWENSFREYQEDTLKKGKIILNSNNQIDEEEISDESSKDTFFSWFFKGKKLGESLDAIDIREENFQKYMTNKNSAFSKYFELNWLKLFDKKVEINLKFKKYIEQYVSNGNPLQDNENKPNYFNRFHAVQYAGLKCIDNVLSRLILKIMYGDLELKTSNTQNDFEMTDKEVEEFIELDTLFDKISIFEKEEIKVDVLDESLVKKRIKKVFIMKELLLAKFKIDHLVIDLYIAILQDKDNFLERFYEIYIGQKSEKSSVNTYSIINDIKENISLICDTTLQDFTKTIQNLGDGIIPKYNRKDHKLKLSPLYPIVGVSGETGDKNEPARKFRLPGYPFVMIATDVMQEGVNLHTFCRSVTHYGLSGTPIDIEQKNGRVDRINSLTHRKILNGEEKYKTFDCFHNDKIQVRFPFVKQSYESLQVRKLSNNLNQYLKSLHDISLQDDSDDTLYILKEISNKKPIPPAYTEFLKTPFEINSIENNKEMNHTIKKLFSKIDLEEKEIKSTIDLLESYLKELGVTDEKNFKLENGQETECKYKGEPFFIKLKPAMSNGELLLEFFLKEENQIIKNIELLVGYSRLDNSEDSLTHRDEVLGAIERLLSDFDIDSIEKNFLTNEHKVVEDAINFWLKQEIIPFDRFKNTKFIREENNLKFIFHNEREQKIQLYTTKIEGREYLLFYTLVTNKNIDINKKIVDIVTFKTISSGETIGFVLHDLEHLNYKEFMYCAYMLGIEADIFESLISTDDNN